MLSATHSETQEIRIPPDISPMISLESLPRAPSEIHPGILLEICLEISLEVHYEIPSLMCPRIPLSSILWIPY